MGTEELGRLLGKGKEAEVFACGDHVLKLYNAAARKSSAFREAANLSVVETLGVAAPVALGVRQIGDRWAVAMTLAAGDFFAEAMLHDPAQAPRCLELMVQLQLAIDSHSAVQLGSMKGRGFAPTSSVRRCWVRRGSACCAMALQNLRTATGSVTGTSIRGIFWAPLTAPWSWIGWMPAGESRVRCLPILCAHEACGTRACQRIPRTLCGGRRPRARRGARLAAIRARRRGLPKTCRRRSMA